jgi:hypothetical protein
MPVPWRSIAVSCLGSSHHSAGLISFTNTSHMALSLSLRREARLLGQRCMRQLEILIRQNHRVNHAKFNNPSFMDVI